MKTGPALTDIKRQELLQTLTILRANIAEREQLIAAARSNLAPQPSATAAVSATHSAAQTATSPVLFSTHQPANVGTLTAAFAACTLEPSKPAPRTNKAISSGQRNNCGFNSIIHTLFALSDNQIRALYNDHIIFNLIMMEFFRHYDLPGAPTVEDLIAFKNAFTHPIDREWIWSDVLRQTLRGPFCEELVRDKEIRASLDDWRFADSDALAEMVKAMGATLKINIKSAYHLKNEGRKEKIYQPAAPSKWIVEMDYNGSHFDFTYPDPNHNDVHNNIRQYGKSYFRDLKDLKIIKAAVQAKYNTLHPSARLAQLRA